MSIKFSFMHYMKWTRVILPAALEEFELFFIFLVIFLFSLSLSIGKRLTLAKTWGAEAHPAPGFYSPGFYLQVQLCDRKYISNNCGENLYTASVDKTQKEFSDPPPPPPFYFLLPSLQISRCTLVAAKIISKRPSPPILKYYGKTPSRFYSTHPTPIIRHKRVNQLRDNQRRIQKKKIFHKKSSYQRIKHLIAEFYTY